MNKYSGRYNNYQKRWRISHKKYLRDYTNAHKKDRIKIQKKYYDTHKKQKHEYYEINKKHHNRIMKKWYYKNKIKINELKKVYMKNRSKTDINYKLRNYLRTRIWFALKGMCKSQKTIKLLGCSIEFLKLHIESKFKPGMFWSNYGKWHIDHIRPCASFDLSKPLEQKRCFNYTNLQPLWAKENLRKSSKEN